ncbi:MAG: substrate-binding domain-containing protein [Oscillospiraceae bacterium]|jgi:ABC-type phosphate transport system substrate-binding protein|nr:substrate-binding domain-containing protein [Oscillospiraceae bacterium]
MKKITALPAAFLLIFLAGCSLFDGDASTEGPSATPAALPTAMIFKEEELVPKIDGSTALIPFAQEILKRTARYGADAATAVTDAFTRTDYAYSKLLQNAPGEEGHVSTILLIYEKPEDNGSDEAKNINDTLEFYPIGIDALVFLTNAKNPVENLKLSEIQNVYAGKITNWSKVGGANKGIMAFQRNAGSGSQNLMDKLVMKGEKMMEAPSQLVPSAKGGLIDGLASYNNSADVLGYSVYYYAKNMYTQPDLKFLSVDGVAPSNETIADGKYALTNDFYAVIRKDEPR